MSVKAKIAAGAATLGLVACGLGVGRHTTRRQATPNCGNSCTNVFSQKYGTRYLLDAWQGRAAVGTPVVLFQKSNSDPSEDFVVTNLGNVHSFYDDHCLVNPP